MTFSKIFLYFCISFILGIFTNSFFNFGNIVLLFLIFGIVLISVLWRHKKIVVLGFCFILFVVGIYRHQQTLLIVVNNELRKHNDSGKEISLIGRVSKEPDIREKNIKLTIDVESIDLKYSEEFNSYIKSKVLITVNRYPEYKYGEKLKIVGELKTPQEFEDFNYKDYLIKDGVYSLMYYPEIERIKVDSISFNSLIYSKILGFKDKFRKSISQNLSSPQSSILFAIILGDKSRISDDWKQKFNITGIRHITCVSGMHIVILSGILMIIGIALGLWRGQAFYFALFFLVLFIIMIGAPPSAVRAGIMGGLFLLAEKIGRLKTADRSLVFVAALMLFYNPLLLKSDVGFQLSFLAVLGIIYLMPIFQNWFSYLNFPKKNSDEPRKKSMNFFKDILAMTLAAQVFTFPILIYNFGYISLISLITNILIAPLLPFIMVLGFISGLVGMVWQTLGWILSLPIWLLLTYVIKIVDFFSQISWIYLVIEDISWIWLFIVYFVLIIITWCLKEKQKLKFLED